MAKRPNKPEGHNVGEGVSPYVVDRAFWLGEGSTAHLDDWVTALEAIDKHGDKKPLLALLKSERDLPQRARFYIADLLDRYRLKKKQGRQPTPAYNVTDIEAMLLMGNMRAHEYVAAGMSVKNALAKAAKELSLDENMLAEHYAGRRGSTNRMKKRHIKTLASTRP
jgi:hypothetical protein